MYREEVEVKFLLLLDLTPNRSWRLEALVKPSSF
jgi:hypothetical protein